MNLANINKKHAAERKQLQTGETAQNLWKGLGDYAFKDPTQTYHQSRMSSVAIEYRQKEKSIRDSHVSSDGDHMTTDYAGMTKELSSLKSNLPSMYKAFDKQAKQQLKAGDWWNEPEKKTQQSYGGENSNEQPQLVDQAQLHSGLTPGGMLKMKELTTSADNEFGRPMENWEAYAYIRYGAPDLAASAEDTAMERASAAAGGGRSARTSGEAAAAESAKQQAAGASPWIAKKQNASIF